MTGVRARRVGLRGDAVGYRARRVGWQQHNRAATMRLRFPFFLAAALVLLGGCDSSSPTDIIYDSADVMPVLVGGIERLEAGIQYPDFEQRAGVEGAVVIQCVVQTTGLTTNVEVIRSVSPGLDRGAVEAVRRARFEPGRQDGRPVAVRISLTITFRAIYPAPPAPAPPPPARGAAAA